MFDLSDKIAIITGGASGIGKSIANILASQGAFSCILDIDEENGNKVIKEITDSGGVGNFYHCDVSDQKAAISAISEIYGKFNKIDILVNNAGISHIGMAHSTSEEDFDRIYRINVKGVYNCLYATIQFMKSKGSGSI